jgi:transposase
VDNDTPPEFKEEAVKQVVDRGHSVADVAGRFGMTRHSLHAWIKQYGPETDKYAEDAGEQNELKCLKKELKRVTEERGKLTPFLSADLPLTFPIDDLFNSALAIVNGNHVTLLN